MTSKSKILRIALLLGLLVALVAIAGAASRPAAATTGSGAERAIYIIQLEGAPLASYRGGVDGIPATNPAARGERKVDIDSPASVAYLAHLQAQQDAFVAGVEQALGRSVFVKYNYQIALNGLAMELSPAEAAVVEALAGVLLVERETFDMPVTDTGPSWIGAPGIWTGSATGGAGSTFGEGIVVGILDTGINVVDNHPSFADIGGDGYDHTNPLADYVGVCAGGNTNPDLTCNDKMIGYRGYNGETPGDSDGHGSHTASTAAGNFTVGSIDALIDVDLDISGVAPHANIISYDVCVTSCPSAGSVAAINDAIADGADVLNFSISGQDNPYTSSVDLAFLGARDAGLFVAASAGNAGPGPDTTNHNAPWITTVAASTHSRTWTNGLVDMSGGAPPPDLDGVAIASGYGPATIVHAGDFGDALCLTPFPGGTFSGQIVVCDRGIAGRVEKGANVLAGGAGGYVLANVDANGESINADAHVLPATHLGDAAGDILRAWLAANPVGSLTATITEGVYTQDPALGDIVAGFSSRGPVQSLPDLIQPDVTAPGVDIFAAYADPVDFGFLSGTSMSSPHTAGAGALMMALQPSWTPAEIQSALMTTGVFDGVLKEDGATQADPFDIGAGRVDLSQAGRAGLVQHETTANYTAANPGIGGEVYTLNTPSMGQNECNPTCSWTRTFRNTQDFTVVYSATLDLPAGVTGTVTPDVLSVAAGTSEDLLVELDTSGAPLGTWLFGELNLTPITPQAQGAGGGQEFCSTPGLSVPDNNPAGVSDTLNVGASGAITYLEAYLGMTHSWVGDLIFELEHGGDSAAIFDRPGVPASTFGCSGNDIDASLADGAATPVETECGAGTPTIQGSFIPGDPPNNSMFATTFGGDELSGDWTMTVSDNAGGDTGTLVEWCIYVEYEGGEEGLPEQHLPIAVIHSAGGGDDPDIVVDPTTILSTQNTNTVTNHPVDISNVGGALLEWSIYEDAGSAPEGAWFDNFDSYPVGTDLHGVAGWKGWFNDPAATAFTTDVQAFSGPASVDVGGGTDLVHEFAGATSGQYVMRTMQYIPGDFSGESYFIMMNQYDDGGVNLNWSTQLRFDSVAGVVESEFDAVTLPLVYDQWVELRNEIDLDADTQSIYYNNTLLITKSWTEGNSGGGALNIANIDLFANGATSIYYDDMSLEGTVGTCDIAGNIPWASVAPDAGDTPPAGTDTVTVTFDSTGYAAGIYDGTLCVESNDPDEPLVEIGLRMTVEQPTDVSLSAFGSEASAVLWPTFVLALVAAVVMLGVVVRKRTE